MRDRERFQDFFVKFSVFDKTRRSKIVLEMKNILRCLITLRCWVDFLFHNRHNKLYHDRTKRCQDSSAALERWSRQGINLGRLRESRDVEGLIFSHRPTSSIATRNYRSKDVWDFSGMARIRRTGLLVNHVYNPESSKSALSTSVKWTRNNTLDSTILASFPHFKRSSSFKRTKFELIQRLDVLEHDFLIFWVKAFSSNAVYVLCEVYCISALPSEINFSRCWWRRIFGGGNIFFKMYAQFRVTGSFLPLFFIGYRATFSTHIHCTVITCMFGTIDMQW